MLLVIGVASRVVATSMQWGDRYVTCGVTTSKRDVHKHARGICSSNVYTHEHDAKSVKSYAEQVLFKIRF